LVARTEGLHTKKAVIREQREKSSELGCGLGNLRSGLGRVGNMKLGDNLRGVT